MLEFYNMCCRSAAQILTTAASTFGYLARWGSTTRMQKTVNCTKCLRTHAGKISGCTQHQPAKEPLASAAYTIPFRKNTCLSHDKMQVPFKKVYTDKHHIAYIIMLQKTLINKNAGVDDGKQTVWERYLHVAGSTVNSRHAQEKHNQKQGSLHSCMQT